MNISLSHRGFCFILQEVYDWAGEADESLSFLRYINSPDLHV